MTLIKAKEIGSRIFPINCRAYKDGRVSCESSGSCCGGFHGTKRSQDGTLFVECGGQPEVEWFRIVAVYSDGSSVETALIPAPAAHSESTCGATDDNEFGIWVERHPSTDSEEGPF